MIKQGVIGAVLLLVCAISGADVLLIEEVRASKAMDLPRSGISKSRVEQKFGAPVKIYDQVGEPPITRWEYPSYSVYFEFDLVITSVLHHGAVISESSNG